MTHSARAIVLGRQGSGKGTQCQLLAASLGVPHLSTGELFRAEVATGTPLGRSVRVCLDSGALVPDVLVLDVVLTRLRAALAADAGYLLDGFPRTLGQADALYDTLGPSAANLAVEIDVPIDVVLPRLAARRVCRGCGATSVACPGDPEVLTCVRCGGMVARREDDTDEAIRRRLALYEEESAPLLVWLDSRGLLVTVDGVGPPDAVAERVLAAVLTHARAVI